MSRYWMGVDLGQQHDYTAIGVLRSPESDLRARPYPVFHPMDARPASGPGPLPASRTLELFGRRTPEPPEPPPVYQVPHLERLSLGLSYVDQVDQIARLLQRPPLRGQTRLVVDATGVGRPVVDLFRRRGLQPIAITIHGGDAVSHDGPGWRVPKRDLVGVLQVLLQQKRLRFAKALPTAELLVSELTGYQVSLSPVGHDTYNARSGQHDDLVLALAVAAWYAERLNRTITPTEPWIVRGA